GEGDVLARLVDIGGDWRRLLAGADVQVDEVGVFALLVAEVLADPQTDCGTENALELRAVDLGIGVGEAADRAVGAADGRLHLLAVVVVVIGCAVDLDRARRIGLEAELIGPQDFRIERLDAAAVASVVGGEAARFGAPAGRTVDQDVVGGFELQRRLAGQRGHLGVDAGRGQGGGAAEGRAEAFQLAGFFLVAQAQDGLPPLGEGVFGLTEQAPGLDLLVVGDLGVGAVDVDEVREVAFVKVLFRIVETGYPGQGAVVVRGQTQFLRQDIHIAAEEGVGLDRGAGIPVAVFAAVQGLIAGDAGQVHALERQIGVQRGAPGGVVPARLGVHIAADGVGEALRQAPTGLGAVLIGGDQIAGAVDRAGVQVADQIQALVLGLVDAAVDVEQGREGLIGRPFQQGAGARAVGVAQTFARVAVSLPGAALLSRDGQTATQGFGQRTGDIALAPEQVVAAPFGHQPGGQFFGRAFGDEADGAAGGAAAVQGALRPAQS